MSIIDRLKGFCHLLPDSVRRRFGPFIPVLPHSDGYKLMAFLARYPARACWRVRYTLSLGDRRRSRARYCKTKAAATALTTRLADLERATCDQIASSDSRPARAATIPTAIAATSILVSITPWRGPGRTAAFCIRPIPLSRPLPSTTVTANAAQADALGDGSESCHVYRYGGGQVWQDCGRVTDDLRQRSAYSLIAHQGHLYCGSGRQDWQAAGPEHCNFSHVCRYVGWPGVGVPRPAFRQ